MLDHKESEGLISNAMIFMPRQSGSFDPETMAIAQSPSLYLLADLVEGNEKAQSILSETRVDRNFYVCKYWSADIDNVIIP